MYLLDDRELGMKKFLEKRLLSFYSEFILYQILNDDGWKDGDGAKGGIFDTLHLLKKIHSEIDRMWIEL